MTALQIIKLSGTKLIYRIMAVLKIETCIVTSVAVSPMGQTVILVIMYVDTFKSDVIVFICIN